MATITVAKPVQKAVTKGAMVQTGITIVVKGDGSVKACLPQSSMNWFLRSGKTVSTWRLKTILMLSLMLNICGPWNSEINTTLARKFLNTTAVDSMSIGMDTLLFTPTVRVPGTDNQEPKEASEFGSDKTTQSKSNINNSIWKDFIWNQWFDFSYLQKREHAIEFFISSNKQRRRNQSSNCGMPNREKKRSLFLIL